MFHSYVKLLKGRPPDLDSNKKKTSHRAASVSRMVDIDTLW